MRITIRVFEENIIHVVTCVLRQTTFTIKNYQGNFTITQQGQFHGFLYETTLPLIKCDRLRPRVTNTLDLNLITPHDV